MFISCILIMLKTAVIMLRRQVFTERILRLQFRTEMFSGRSFIPKKAARSACRYPPKYSSIRPNPDQLPQSRVKAKQHQSDCTASKKLSLLPKGTRDSTAYRSSSARRALRYRPCQSRKEERVFFRLFKNRLLRGEKAGLFSASRSFLSIRSS